MVAGAGRFVCVVEVVVRVLCVGAVVVAAVLGGSGGAVAGGGGAGAEPEADVAYHGRIAMTRGLAAVSLTPENHGPDDVPGATVRLVWSVPLEDGVRLPGACVRSGERGVLCRTGALPAGWQGERLHLAVRLRGAPREVTVTVGTVWNGGAVDLNPRNNEHAVLVLDSGDSYYF
ncbi:hypothetical protein [Streptomyces aureocirculatus]|uniref:hypothetical protein n=1 Tax=Streptomyces aureocirculatus TaxID=67275 RepID=UPI000691EE40|nr:hypothetical protein [Streptomyces aureocirculatus]